MKKAKLKIFKDKKGEWRWSIKAYNGNKLCTPGEGYKTRAGCIKNLKAVEKAFKQFNLQP